MCDATEWGVLRFKMMASAVDLCSPIAIARIIGPQRFDGVAHALDAIYPPMRAVPAEWDPLITALDDAPQQCATDHPLLSSRT